MNLHLNDRIFISAWLFASMFFCLSATSPLNHVMPNFTIEPTKQKEETTFKSQTSSKLIMSSTSIETQNFTLSSKSFSKVTVSESQSSNQRSEAHIDIFKSHFSHVGVLLYISVTTLISSLLVIGYHHCHKLTVYLPESCFLLCIGIIAGCIIRFTNLDNVMPDTFSPDTFFLVLLPPIILGSSYSLNNRVFYENLGVVLLFAVLGTAAACFLIAPFLYGLSQTSALILPSTNVFKQIFVFSAFIVAVDPVARLHLLLKLLGVFDLSIKFHLTNGVRPLSFNFQNPLERWFFMQTKYIFLMGVVVLPLSFYGHMGYNEVLAVFSELGVNKPLHIVVFGESLLNDGVSVVLYRVMININKMTQISGEHIGLAFLKFLVCIVISSLIGGSSGVFATLICKYSHSRPIMEPVIILTTAYISYLIAESLDLSGIIGMIVCGLVQAQYAFHNINSKSRTNIKFIIKVISTSAELVIFIFLGISVARTEHQWNAGFIIWSLVACIISRVIVTFLFSFFVNKFHGERMKIFSFEEQIIMAFGGLRGGVAFSLSLQLDEKDVPLRNTFITTVLIIILFNVVIQGITIQPLVNFLKVKLEKKSKKNLMTTINNKLIDEILHLMEKIVGRRSGHNMWRKRVENFELHHIQSFLLKSPHPSESKIESVHTKVAMRDMHNFLLSLHSPILSANADMHNPLPITRSSVLSDNIYTEMSTTSQFSSIQELNAHRLSHLLSNQHRRHTQNFQQKHAAENAGFEETDAEDNSTDAFHKDSLSSNPANYRKQSKKNSQQKESTDSTKENETTQL